MNLDDLSMEAHRNASEKGFWKLEDSILAKMANPKLQLEFTQEEIKAVVNAFKTSKIALIMCEGAEAIEALRKGENESEEMADIVIRTGDYCGGYNVDLEGHAAVKMEKNKLRPVKHGKAF